MFRAEEKDNGELHVYFEPVDSVAKADAGISPYKYLDNAFNQGGVEAFSADDKVNTLLPAVYKKQGNVWVLDKKGVIEVVGKTPKTYVETEVERYQSTTVDKLKQPKTPATKKAESKTKKVTKPKNLVTEILSKLKSNKDLVIESIYDETSPDFGPHDIVKVSYQGYVETTQEREVYKRGFEEFGEVEETAIIITIKELYAAKINRHVASYNPNDAHD